VDNSATALASAKLLLTLSATAALKWCYFIAVILLPYL